MLNLRKIFQRKEMDSVQKKDEIANLLRTTPELLDRFEQAYRSVLDEEQPGDFYETNAKQAAALHEGIPSSQEGLDEVMERIIGELVDQTPVWRYDGKSVFSAEAPYERRVPPVTNAELKRFGKDVRPQLSGNLMMKDIHEPSYLFVLDLYKRSLEEKNPVKKKHFYELFRQGLDITDLDGVLYEVLGMNKNSMGYWLPRIIDAVREQDLLKVPETTIIKVPLSVLQLTRMEYESLNRTTLDIVDRFCKKVFRLDESKEYFIKTGTYSSKYDFRNAYVHGAKEVRELGEYLLFIQHYASMMAGPLSSPSIYGVSTTNEWVVREFIPDKEGNPCIYKGLPLHTEYRVFVDFDTKELIGISPYWEPETMKKRFAHGDDADSPHQKHDYIIYVMHEPELMEKYHENKAYVERAVEKLIQNVDSMHGQWSMDIMQNGNDFWLIDMALAAESALAGCIPKGKLKPLEENWLPDLSNEQ